MSNENNGTNAAQYEKKAAESLIMMSFGAFDLLGAIGGATAAVTSDQDAGAVFLDTIDGHLGQIKKAVGQIDKAVDDWRKAI